MNVIIILLGMFITFFQSLLFIRHRDFLLPVGLSKLYHNIV
nr:MAG TPA_asm: hypothetical protein [Caudoviricetes sp.]